MIKYSIIIPTYNRNRNLVCCLLSLVKQTYDTNNWEVIIVDEGTESAINPAIKYSEVLNIKYLWQKSRTGNPGPSKNWASHNSKGEALIFIDSDIILNDKALENYNKLHTRYPESIICGRYDWLFPMDITEFDIAERFDDVINNRFPIIANWAPGPVPGVDARFQDKRTKQWTKPSNLSPISGKPFALGMFGGNLLIPKKLFIESGGFDPNIVKHGGEDACLGWELFKRGAKALFSEEVIGWHIWHPRNQEANEKSVKRNIEYIENKYRELHIKYGVIENPNEDMIYYDDGTFVPDEVQKNLRAK